MKQLDWIKWGVATFVAGLTLCTGAFAIFETKDTALERRDSIERRLVRIEEKLDRLLNKYH